MMPRLAVDISYLEAVDEVCEGYVTEETNKGFVRTQTCQIYVNPVSRYNPAPRARRTVTLHLGRKITNPTATIYTGV